MEYLLIQKDDFAHYRPLPKAFNDDEFRDKVKPCIEQAQLFSLKPEITADFYNEVITVAKTGADSGNLTEANFVALREYLVPALVYFAWANLVEQNQATVTRYSVVQKTDASSQPVSSNGIKQQALAYNNTGHGYLNRLIEFIEENPSNYSTYKKSNTKTSGNRNIRLSSISIT